MSMTAKTTHCRSVSVGPRGLTNRYTGLGYYVGCRISTCIRTRGHLPSHRIILRAGSGACCRFGASVFGQRVACSASGSFTTGLVAVSTGHTFSIVGVGGGNVGPIALRTSAGPRPPGHSTRSVLKRSDIAHFSTSLGGGGGGHGKGNGGRGLPGRTTTGANGRKGDGPFGKRGTGNGANGRGGGNGKGKGEGKGHGHGDKGQRGGHRQRGHRGGHGEPHPGQMGGSGRPGGSGPRRRTGPTTGPRDGPSAGPRTWEDRYHASLFSILFLQGPDLMQPVPNSRRCRIKGKRKVLFRLQNRECVYSLQPSAKDGRRWLMPLSRLVTFLR